MPYGSGQTGANQGGTTRAYRYDASGVLVETAVSTNVIPGSTWSRSGNNASPTLLRTAPKVSVGSTWKYVVTTEPRGPRLAYKVLSKRTGKLVWAREQISVYKLKRVKTRVKVGRGMDLPPNNLSFTKKTFTPTEDLGSVYGQHPISKQSTNILGYLWSSFALGGNFGSLGPNPSNYSSLSGQEALVARLDSQALSGLYEKVKNQNINIAQAFAERAQTGKMIAESATRLARALLAIKRLQFLKAAGILFPKNSKELARDHLMIQYGVIPLMSDIDGMAKHLAETKKISFDLISSRTEKIPVTPIYDVTHTAGIRCRTIVSESWEVTVKYKARCEVVAPLLREFGQLGVLNPAAVAWEIVPWSFVIDWLLPIGDYLNNLDAFSQVRLVHLHKTVAIRRVVECKRSIGGTDSFGFVWGNKNVGWKYDLVSVVRQAGIALPALPAPRFKDPSSGSHILNALALIRQLHK